MGPLLATTMLLSSLEASASTPLRSRSPNQEPLPRPPWLVESPVAILGERNRKAFLQATGLSALSLSQSTLLSLQTVISLIFLIHLIATRISRTLQTTPSRGNWRRFSSYVVFSSGVTFTLFIMREAFEALGLPIWTGLARWEMITASISFQTNMYSISRLGRGSFTLGELGIVAALGVTLMIETINLTLARLFPNSTLFLKTFRTATPLLIFQLALIVGTFFIGFLLSPLLYLSRHLAQKPVHRLRWPHKRDLHRRLLAGFFYLFAAAYIVGALGLWVRWMLDGRDPWIWTAFFVVDGQRWWTRPAIITHWILWISASIAGWQTVVVRAKRLRPRNPVAAQKAANTKLMGNSHSHTHETSAAAHAQSPSSWNIVPGRSSETLQTKVKKSTHLSLNARRKFFHALAVILYTPAIALDVSRRSHCILRLIRSVPVLSFRTDLQTRLLPTIACTGSSGLLSGLLSLHLRRVCPLLCSLPFRSDPAHLPLGVHRSQRFRSSHLESFLPPHWLRRRPVARGPQTDLTSHRRPHLGHRRCPRFCHRPQVRPCTLAQKLQNDRRLDRVPCQRHCCCLATEGYWLVRAFQRECKRWAMIYANGRG